MPDSQPAWTDNSPVAVRQVKRFIHRIPGVGGLARYVAQKFRDARVKSTASYWETRYRTGDSSGVGSYGVLAHFKAEVINSFVHRNRVASVIELGCGDGAQLGLAQYPAYVGIDLSPTAVARCKERFAGDASKRFFALAAASDYRGTYDLALSLDVVYHLLEDDVFADHMRTLFSLAGKYVIIYSTNYDGPGHRAHIRHHAVTDWVAEHAPEWVQIDFIRNRYPYDRQRPAETSFADFYHFGRR